MPTIDPKPDDESPPAAPAGGHRAANRFCRVGSTWLDLAAVVAVAVEDGGYTLHLSGGQAVALPATAAETPSVLKRLGLPKQKVKGKTKKLRANGASRPVAAGGLLAAIAGFFSG